MKRADYRDKETFEKDILFSTKVEEFWMKVWLGQIADKYDKIEYEDYGTDNTGVVTKYASTKADYKVLLYKNKKKETKLLDVKWGPIYGKATFKVAPLQKYIRDNASILLFYNIGYKPLKKPKDYKLEQHLELLRKNFDNIRYTIIKPDTIKRLLEDYPNEKVWYMGNKLSIIIPKEDFYKYWRSNKIKDI